MLFTKHISFEMPPWKIDLRLLRNKIFHFLLLLTANKTEKGSFAKTCCFNTWLQIIAFLPITKMNDLQIKAIKTHFIQ